jgi:hypothetical protein
MTNLVTSSFLLIAVQESGRGVRGLSGGKEGSSESNRALISTWGLGGWVKTNDPKKYFRADIFSPNL